MKAETKAKRRVTLSLAGLGWLDETELETIPQVRVGEPNGDQAPAPVTADVSTVEADVPDVPAPASTDQAPMPVTIPVGLPCAGQAIAALKPAQLRMLLSKVDQLAGEQGRAWQPLLEVLATERAARLQAGQRPKLVAVEGDGHGP
jgi:hypothetical protein